MKDLIDFGRTCLAFPFGLMAELCCFIMIKIQPDMVTNFDYLKDNK